MLLSEISAERLTPPTTTTSPTLQTKSCASIASSLLPAAFLNISIAKSKRFTSGCGPEALPPIVFSLAPAGLMRVTSTFGICPPYNIAISSLNACAHPALLS